MEKDFDLPLEKDSNEPDDFEFIVFEEDFDDYDEDLDWEGNEPNEDDL
jgi:hypothetical protein